MFNVYWLSDEGEDKAETFAKFQQADDRFDALEDEGLYVSIYRILPETGEEIRIPRKPA